MVRYSDGFDMKAIDINCDVGEGVGNEPQLMPLISSCNIACGGHAGDTETIRDTIRLAIKNKVRIGVIRGTQIRLILVESRCIYLLKT